MSVGSLKMASLKTCTERGKWVFLLQEGPRTPSARCRIPPSFQAARGAPKGRSLKTKQKAAVNVIRAP